jgi:hypothetical protein
MSIKNFTVKNGISVGSNEIISANGDVIVRGNLMLDDHMLVSSTGDLTVSGNLIIGSTTIQANVNNHANSAYIQANTGTILAQAAFDRANNATDTWVRDAANSASSYANSAFSTANTATTNAATADQRAVTSGSYANSAFITANTKYNSTGGTISGDVNITGNLNITGNTVTHASDSLVINDPLILLANNNPGNLLDTGFIAHYIEGGTTKHTGLVRDSSANTYYLFDSYTPHIQETNILDPNDASLRITTLRSNLISDSVLVRGYDVVNHTNTAFSQANTATTNAATADQRAVTSGVYANSAFATANSKTSNVGTVTSVGGTGNYGGLTLTGTVTTSGNLTLGGTPTGTWPITAANITGQTNSATITASTTAGAASTIVQRDGNGYIFNTYFNSTDNSISSGVTAIIAKQTDNYYRSATAAAVATFISGQSMNIAGSATSLTSSNFISQTGSTGSWNGDFQNTAAGTAKYGGDVGANGTNGPGGSWWIQQNFRHTNGSNYWGTQVAWGWEDNANKLATRNVTGGSFGAWVYYLNSSNYTSYAPSLTGSGASGNWGINITGNAATATTAASYLPLAGGGMTGVLATVGNASAFTSANDSTFSVRSSGAGTAASMSFHRPGAYAVNLGLDTDNIFKLGGWSASTVHHYWDFSGNAYATVSMRAPIFYDLNDTAYYCDPQSTSRFNILSVPSPAGSGTFPVSISSTDRGIIFGNSSGSGIPCYFTVSSGATVSGSIIASGGSTAYNTSSDYRMKENDVGLDTTAALAKIMSLRPVAFDWKQQFGGMKGIGFIAHELDLVAPECVNGEKDAVNENGSMNPQSVDASFLIPSICSAMQKQQQLIEQLMAEVAALKGN